MALSKEDINQIEEMQFIMLNTHDILYTSIDMMKKNYDGSGDKRFFDEAKQLYLHNYKKQRVGLWLEEKDPRGKLQCFHCSICDEEFNNICNKTKTNYCPDCGARLY